MKQFLITIFNSKSMRFEHKFFSTIEQADSWFEAKKKKTNGRSPINLSTAFSYTNEWGNILSVAKKY